MSQGLSLPSAPIFSALDVGGTTSSLSFRTTNWLAGENSNNYRISEIGDDNPYFQIQRDGYFTFYSKSSEENNGSVTYPIKMIGDNAAQRIGVNFNDQGQMWCESNNLGIQTAIGSITLYVPTGQSINYFINNSQKISMQANTTAINNRVLVNNAVDNTTDSLQVLGTTKSTVLRLDPQSSAPTAVRGGIYFNSNDNSFKICKDGSNWVNLA